MNSPRLAAWSLVAVAAVWGAAFVIMKPAIEQQPFFDFLALRFTIAAVIMLVVRPRVLVALQPRTLAMGGSLGVVLGLAYITQTIALELTTAAITGFLTGVYVVLTPVLGWLFFRQRIGAKVAIGSVLALVGLGFISITGLSIEIGQVWGIVCAVLFALHIVGLGRFSPTIDSYALTFVQLCAVAVVCWIGALPDGFQGPPNPDVWIAVLFTAVFATVFAFFVQTWAQAKLDASRVAIILTLEVVFTAAISVGVGQEVLAIKTVIGGALMIVAMLIVEWPSRGRRARIAGTGRPGDGDEVVPLEPLPH
ncbi:DMT family transporter [Diaminobutyricimonas sp. LJ205]|uniref:DMT family transporter n=1 Tax=Diaminobutyricimonas sp. LJ205 TaxID=2683590 RepID=UPI0018DF12B5|nr:DMT family transporter [Diaminobutyricimonas sp. LJ205]